MDTQLRPHGLYDGPHGAGVAKRESHRRLLPGMHCSIVKHSTKMTIAAFFVLFFITVDGMVLRRIVTCVLHNLIDKHANMKILHEQMNRGN
jgi:hypothetical protein